MFLYFNDAGRFLPDLEAKGFPHGGRLIKIFATPYDQGEVLSRAITALESPHVPFTEDEMFQYPERDDYLGPRLESDLTSLGLHSLGQDITRALLRFSYRGDLLFSQYAMGAKWPDGSWFMDHPFQGIDGIRQAAGHPTVRTTGIHLDIFSRRSVPNLGKVIDLNNPETFATDSELRTLMRDAVRRGMERQ